MNQTLLLALGLVALGMVGGEAGAAVRGWNQAEAKKMVSKVLEMEKKKSRPWNRIPWRTSVANAAKEAKETGKPILVFLYTEAGGPPQEPCSLEGRLLRTHVLSNSTVLSIIKSNYVPVKLKLDPAEEFPVDWPALDRWATGFKFAGGKGYAGCSVVSADLQIEYGNSGSARLWELFDSRAFNSKKFADMLERAASRLTEERSLRVQRGISDFERRMELHGFRRGVTKAVRSEQGTQLPPKGYSLEQAVELKKMAGVEKENPAKKK